MRGQECSYNKIQILVILNSCACYRFLIEAATDQAYKQRSLHQIEKCYDGHTIPWRMGRVRVPSQVLYISPNYFILVCTTKVIDLRQISVSLDEHVADQLEAASEAMQIPLSAATRLAILHGIDYLNKFKTGRDFYD